MNIGEMHKTRDDNKLPTKKKQDIKNEVKGQILHFGEKAESCWVKVLREQQKQLAEIERSLLEYPISGGRVFVRICLQITPPHRLRRHHTDDDGCGCVHVILDTRT